MQNKPYRFGDLLAREMQRLDEQEPDSKPAKRTGAAYLWLSDTSLDRELALGEDGQEETETL